MAKLSNVATVSATGDSSFAMLASLGVLCGMVFALLGIKIWWFKHRLTFDHSGTSNGAAGGSTPTVPIRPRSSKDKRLSQQIREPVEVHGVFRKRQEDDFDIVPTKQLPPVRIRKLSQSTPSLFHPPKRNIELTPPTREPPKPPMVSLSTASPKDIIDPETASVPEVEQKFNRMGVQGVNEDELNASHPEQEQETNKLSHKFVKARTTSEPERMLVKLQERRATGYLRPDKDDLYLDTEFPPEVQAMLTPQCSIEEFGERRPTGYIKYAEIDADGLEDFHAKWQSVRTNIDNTFEHDNGMNERHHYEMYNAIQHMTPINYFDEPHKQAYTATSATPKPVVEEVIHDVESVGDGLAVDTTVKRSTWESAKQQTGNTSESVSPNFTNCEKDVFGECRSIKSTPGNRPLSWDASTAYSTYDEEGPFGESRSMKTPVEERPFSWNAGHLKEQINEQNANELQNDEETPHVVQFALPYDKTSYDSDIEDKDTRKMRRPTGYVPHNSQLWTELEYDIKQEDDDKCLWQEMQNELTKDLVSSVEEEFNKIRNSYEENEADFLEPSNLSRIPKQMDLPSPDGFGKSIDEDWESFEHLTNEHRFARDKNVHFNIPNAEIEDSDKESNLRTTRRPTGYVINSTELFTELEFEVNDNHASFIDDIVNKSSIKERRPTGYTRPNAQELKEEYENEHCKESIFEPADLTPPLELVRKPKPRQKVTFDFTTTEYYLASDNVSSTNRQLSEEEAVNAEYNSDATSTIPKPMQRITKMQFNSENSSGSGMDETPNLSPPPVPILFGTHVSYDDADTDANDSWEAIRQRRCIYEETQHTALPVEEPPKPAYRNPLALSIAHDPTQPAPHAQARRHKFDNNYGANTTEA